LASFSKSKQFFSKDFQTILWRFSGIPMGYKGKKQKRPTSKYFAAPSSFWTYSDAVKPHSADSSRDGAVGRLTPPTDLRPASAEKHFRSIGISITMICRIA
jgi:hypothetical protein